MQAIQTVDNSVTLLAKKPTLVRVYLDASALPAAIPVSGELTWRQGSGGGNYLPSLNRVRLDPAANPALNRLRADLAASLNFSLPPQALSAGQLELRLNRVLSQGGGDQIFTDGGVTVVNLVNERTLRVRVIGLRYKYGTPEKTAAPSAVHFAFMRSFLVRAYPISTIDWSQIVVDANFAPPFDAMTPVLANAQIAAIRSRDVSNGVDPRTHYYGLVDDAGGLNFMRGRAFTIPNTPRPDVVASGPVGVPGGFAGDQDESYADWYSAHELGHTFGRFHPGFPPFDPQTGSGQDASDPSFPYPNGQISANDGRFIGLDLGDPALNLTMRVLNGTTHHDVMTYRDHQWLSAYTYESILMRLVAEEALGPPGS